MLSPVISASVKVAMFLAGPPTPHPMSWKEDTQIPELANFSSENISRNDQSNLTDKATSILGQRQMFVSLTFERAHNADFTL